MSNGNSINTFRTAIAEIENLNPLLSGNENFQTFFAGWQVYGINYKSTEVFNFVP